MKILWFANSPCGSLRRSASLITGGGWLISLEDEIKKNSDIDLNVCFISEKMEGDFVFEDVHYFPIVREKAKNGVKRIVNRYRYSLDADNRCMLPQLIEVVEKVQPDIIHIHGTEECFGLLQDVVKDIPIVFSIQGLIAPCTEKYYSGYPQEFVRKYEHWSNKFRGISTEFGYKDFKARGEQELHYLQNAKYIIGRTNFDHFIPMLCNPDVKIFRGEEILRPEFYSKQWTKTAFGNPFKIVTTISSGVYKGYETVLHTSALLKQYANFDYEWNIIGYDDKSEWVHIAEKYKGFSSAESNIKLLGRKTAAEMVDILVDCDLYVQVSHIENSPNSVCEAMLLGMPIAASFAGGTSSILKDGEEGILVQDGDPYVLGGAIVTVANDFTKAKTFGDKARQRAIDRHNPKYIGGTLLETYELIIG